MEITNTIHDIIMGQVDDRLEPARVLAEKTKESLQARESALRGELREKMRELAKEADRKFRAWVARRKDGKGIRLTRAEWNVRPDECVFNFRDPDRFALPFSSSKPGDAFGWFRREVLQRALRVASENPPRTAYAAVDEYLLGLDPVAELKKRLAEAREVSA